MRIPLSGFLLLCLVALPILAFAQTQPPGTADVVVNYTLPSKNTDGSDIPATGSNALTTARIYLSNTSIPADVSGLTPTLEAGINTSTIVPAFATSVGATIHVRVVVCNLAGVCSDASNEGTGIVTAKKPGSAVLNTVTITIK